MLLYLYILQAFRKMLPNYFCDFENNLPKTPKNTQIVRLFFMGGEKYFAQTESKKSANHQVVIFYPIQKINQEERKMEVMFKNMLHAYKGKCDGIVYYYNSRVNKVCARRIPEFKPNKSTETLSIISRNVKKLNPSPDYINDMKFYLEMLRFIHKKEWNRVTSWYCLFKKMMYAMAKKHNLDLRYLTREQIEHQQLPCISVKAAVDDGLLPVIPSYERFNNPM